MFSDKYSDILFNSQAEKWPQMSHNRNCLLFLLVFSMHGFPPCSEIKYSQQQGMTFLHGKPMEKQLCLAASVLPFCQCLSRPLGTDCGLLSFSTGLGLFQEPCGVLPTVTATSWVRWTPGWRPRRPSARPASPCPSSRRPRSSPRWWPPNQSSTPSSSWESRRTRGVGVSVLHSHSHAEEVDRLMTWIPFGTFVNCTS